ncbi:hypothetical protein B0H34DRAFT_736046, partial [Crassisporium funariophilum]
GPRSPLRPTLLPTNTTITNAYTHLTMYTPTLTLSRTAKRPPDPDPPPLKEDNEERMPPKMRKRWMHREVEAL